MLGRGNATIRSPRKRLFGQIASGVMSDSLALESDLSRAGALDRSDEDGASSMG
jgi:hypothetical protein